MSRNTYLTRKNGTFYFRIATPQEIRGKIHRKELIYSLKTKCPYEGKSRSLIFLKASQQLFKQFKTMPRLKPEEAQSIVKTYFKECLDRLEQQMDEVDDTANIMAYLPNGNPAIDMTGDRKRLDFLYPDIFHDDKGEVTLGLEDHYEPDLKRIVASLANQNSLEAPQGTISYSVLENATKRAVEELLYRHKQYVNYETEIKTKDDLFKSFAPSMPNMAVISDDTPALSLTTQKYLDECIINKEGQHSIDSKQATYQLWIEIFGDHQTGQIDKKKATTFKDILIKLPKNKNKDKLYSTKSIADLLKMNIPTNKRMSTTTINMYLGEMSSFAKWSINNGYLLNDKNPFDGLRLKKNKKSSSRDSRNPFSDQQLQAIFSTPFFQGCESDNTHGRFKEGKKLIKDAYYWIPLIALYTGARMGEIIQLKPSDLKQDNNIWYFDINDDDGKSVKTLQSKRKLPLHSKLIGLGLIKYVQDCKKDRIFHEIKPYYSDYSHYYSKWFGRFLERFNIKEDKTSFHSFRHNFRDALKGRVNETHLRALMGHDKGDVHNAYGSSNFDMTLLKGDIEKLDYNILPI